MTTYDVRYLTKREMPGGMTVIARDVRHAIEQVLELKPDVRVIKALPESMWNK